jgi:hypothetical protein
MVDAIKLSEDLTQPSVARPLNNTPLSELSNVVTLKEKINRVETTKEVSSNLSSDIII